MEGQEIYTPRYLGTDYCLILGKKEKWGGHSQRMYVGPFTSRVSYSVKQIIEQNGKYVQTSELVGPDLLPQTPRS